MVGKLAQMKKAQVKAAEAAPEMIEDTPSRGGPAPKGRTKKLSTYVTSGTWKALQQQKIEEERPVNDIVNDAIQLYLKSVGGPEKK